jgi:HK97 gp10 family phage protein
LRRVVHADRAARAVAELLFVNMPQSRESSRSTVRESIMPRMRSDDRGTAAGVLLAVVPQRVLESTRTSPRGRAAVGARAGETTMSRPVVELKLDGGPQLRRALAELRGATQRRIVGPAANKAMTPINRAAKRNAKSVGDTGLLAKSIGKIQRTYKRAGVVMTIIGARKGFRQVINGKPRDPSLYAHLVEYGTAPHGSHPGAAPKPFLRPAFDANKAQAQRIFVRTVRERLDAAARKAAAKGRRLR